MYGYYALMALLGLMVAAGWRYRAATVAFAVLWTASFLMQKAAYNNHYYLLAILAVMLAAVPAHRARSIDARRSPSCAAGSCPRWCCVIFVVQTSIVYVYAALAKLQPDWLAGKPLRVWFETKTGYPLIGPLYGLDWFQLAVARGGVLFDLAIVPALLWRRSRPFAFVVAVVFHVFNSITFGIGIFPYLALALCVFFFPPETIRRVFFRAAPAAPSAMRAGVSRLPLVLAGVFLLVQLVVPARHWLIPGDVNWTEEGHRLSWRMMLRSKSGWLRYRVVDSASGREWSVDPRLRVTSKQFHKMATHPDMILQFARRLADEHASEGRVVQVYTLSKVSLNGRPFRPLVDPETDLARAAWRPLAHDPWITPSDR